MPLVVAGCKEGCPSGQGRGSAAHPGELLRLRAAGKARHPPAVRWATRARRAAEVQAGAGSPAARLPGMASTCSFALSHQVHPRDPRGLCQEVSAGFLTCCPAGASQPLADLGNRPPEERPRKKQRLAASGVAPAASCRLRAPLLRSGPDHRAWWQAAQGRLLHMAAATTSRASALPSSLPSQRQRCCSGRMRPRLQQRSPQRRLCQGDVQRARRPSSEQLQAHTLHLRQAQTVIWEG